MNSTISTNLQKSLEIISIISICKNQVQNTQYARGMFVKIWSKVLDVHPLRKKAAMHNQS